MSGTARHVFWVMLRPAQHEMANLQICRLFLPDSMRYVHYVA
jgi:hypothetical protein